MSQVRMYCVMQYGAMDDMQALTKLEVQHSESLQHLPTLARLTALESLELDSCRQLQHQPPLTTLTALLKLKVRNCAHL
jgi:hypothetical protein